MTKYHWLLLLSVVVTAISQLLLKKGAFASGKRMRSVYLNVFTISGYCLLLCVMILNLFIFKYLTMIAIVFFLPITYIVIAVGSSIIFEEKITKNKIIATMLILAGLSLYYYQ